MTSLSGQPSNAIASGYTLIELLAVLTVLAVLATLAQVTWWEHVLRVRRSDATSALLRAAAAQENFYLAERRYAENAARPVPDGLGLPGTDHGWYTLTVESADTEGFLVSARPAIGSSQVSDDDCQRFTIDQAGRRGSAPAAPETCWR